MGAKAWFIAYFDGDSRKVLAGKPRLDRTASRDLAARLLPRKRLTEIEDGNLGLLDPDEDKIFAGSYPGLRIVAHLEMGDTNPSRVERRWVDPSLGRIAYLHATHSVVDWFAFGLWRDGKLVRSLSMTPDDGIYEQIGPPLPFEKPYWSGKHALETEPGEDPYPLPFHPLELAEDSLLHHLGFQFEGLRKNWVCDPFKIPIMRFAVAKLQKRSRR
jgi:hypothetical protein